MRVAMRWFLLTAFMWVALSGIDPVSASADSGSSQIAYIANDWGSIHDVQADGSNDRPIVTASTAAHIGDIAWSQNGSTLAYTTISTPPGAAPQHIYLFDTMSGATTELKSSAPTYGPIAFFPDGKHLAAISNVRAAEAPTCHGGQALTIDIETGSAMPLVSAGCTVVGLQVTSDGAILISSDHGSNPPGT